VASLHTVLTLRPRHDPLQVIYQFLFGLYDFSYNPSDILTLDFKLHPTTSAPEGVFAVVRKGELKTIKRERWDLVSSNEVPCALTQLSFYKTFTKTTEHNALPPSLSVMSGTLQFCVALPNSSPYNTPAQNLPTSRKTSSRSMETFLWSRSSTIPRSCHTSSRCRSPINLLNARRCLCSRKNARNTSSSSSLSPPVHRSKTPRGL